MLSGEEPVTSGEFNLGHNAEPDYFAQDQYKVLDPEASILDDLATVAARSNNELRNVLGCFLFSDDDVFKKIGVLSGGERNRYALARMLMNPSNFLLLDEPTNHLDMRAKDVLLKAIEDFQGTVVFVSHDRYFIDKLATRVFEVADGKVTLYPGNYEDYLWRKSGGGSAAVPAISTPAKQPAQQQRQSAPQHHKQSAPQQAAKQAPVATVAPPVDDKQRRLNPIKLRQMKERQRSIEDEITRLEVEIADFEQALSSFQSAAHSIEIAEILESRRTDMKNLMAEWEEVSEILEANR
jgi:ATP-binding cassette subfamily F protein 3